MQIADSGAVVIHTQALRKTYNLGKASKEVTAIRALSLRVPRNTIFGFIGPNGAGKTTAIKLLLGLTRPTAGSATILGIEVRLLHVPGDALWAAQCRAAF